MTLPYHLALILNIVWHEIFAGSNFCDFSSDPEQ